MPLTHIALFKAPEGGPGDALQKTLKSDHSKASQGSAAGLQIQDRDVIQLTSEKGSLEDDQLFRNIRSSCGEPIATYSVNLNASTMVPGALATAPVMEVVTNFFPVSRVTPDFQKQVEKEFLEFDSICKTMAKDDLDLAYGWSADEQDHEAIGEKTRPFFILRGWQSMRDFEDLTKQEKFGQEAIPILLAWKAPYEMWHIEHRE